MIIVTGATGRLGSLIVDRLLARVPAEQIGVSVRDVDRAAPLAARGVRVRAGDFTAPATLEKAFEDADQVLLVSTSIRGKKAFPANKAAVDAARAAGAKRILYTSHQACSPASLFPPQGTHAATERCLADSGVPFTALRNGFYASTLGYYVGAALETGRLALPQDGPVSWTAHEDLADAAAAALADAAALDGVTPPLTASQALDFGEVAAVLGELTGRTIERVVVDDEEWTAAAIAQGVDPEAAAFTLSMFRAARAGEFTVTDPTLENVIGHPPVTARRVLEDLVHAA